MRARPPSASRGHLAPLSVGVPTNPLPTAAAHTPSLRKEDDDDEEEVAERFGVQGGGCDHEMRPSLHSRDRSNVFPHNDRAGATAAPPASAPPIAIALASDARVSLELAPAVPRPASPRPSLDLRTPSSAAAIVKLLSYCIA